MTVKRKFQESDLPEPFPEPKPADSQARNPWVWVVGATGLAVGAGLASMFQSQSVMAPPPPQTAPETRPAPEQPKIPPAVPNDPG